MGEIVIGDVVVRAGGTSSLIGLPTRTGTQGMIPVGVQVDVASMPVEIPEGGERFDGSGTGKGCIHRRARSTYSVRRVGPDQGGLV